MSMLKRYLKYKQFGDHDFEITSKISPIHNSSVDRSRKEEPTIHNAMVARQRARKSLDDVLRCNEWKFFVTLTFNDIEYQICQILKDGPLHFNELYANFDDLAFVDRAFLHLKLLELRKRKCVDYNGFLVGLLPAGENICSRSDDQNARDLFAKWRKWVRKNYPDMYYVAVPEYHTAGCLHFHIVVGGVTAEDLGLVDSGRVLHNGKAWRSEDFIERGFLVNKVTGEGLPIFNMPNWTFGFSTCTEVRSTLAVSRYIAKYISKVNIDPRFYNKKHYYTSHNVKRPTVVSEEFPADYSLTVNKRLSEYGAEKIFSDLKLLRFEKYSVPTSKEDVIRMRLSGAIPIPKYSLPFKI